MKIKHTLEVEGMLELAWATQTLVDRKVERPVASFLAARHANTLVLVLSRHPFGTTDPDKARCQAQVNN